jgi:hypothetical protein
MLSGRQTLILDSEELEAFPKGKRPIFGLKHPSIRLI